MFIFIRSDTFFFLNTYAIFMKNKVRLWKGNARIRLQRRRWHSAFGISSLGTAVFSSRHSRRTKGPSELRETTRLTPPFHALVPGSGALFPSPSVSSNFQRFDGRLISKIYEPLASSRSRVKDAVRSNGA